MIVTDVMQWEQTKLILGDPNISSDHLWFRTSSISVLQASDPRLKCNAFHRANFTNNGSENFVNFPIVSVVQFKDAKTPRYIHIDSSQTRNQGTMAVGFQSSRCDVVLGSLVYFYQFLQIPKGISN